MGTTSYFHWLFRRRSAFKLALSLAFLFVFMPTHVLDGESSRLDEIKEEEAEWIHESLNVYSILRLYQVELGETSAWDVTQTILNESLKHSLDPMLVLAIIKVESGFRHGAVSAGGARGLMQVHPVIAHDLAEDCKFRYEGKHSLNDPIVNVRLGISYFGFLKDKFRNLKLALTAYNQGPSRVKIILEKEEELPQEYATRVLSTYRHFQKQRWQREKALSES